MQKTHVVFGESIEGAMQLLALPDPIMALTDDLSAGPLGDMLSEGTGEERVQWWTQVLAPPNPRYLERLKRSWQQFRTWLLSRNSDEAVIIWAAVREPGGDDRILRGDRVFAGDGSGVNH